MTRERQSALRGPSPRRRLRLGLFCLFLCFFILRRSRRTCLLCLLPFPPLLRQFARFLERRAQVHHLPEVLDVQLRLFPLQLQRSERQLREIPRRIRLSGFDLSRLQLPHRLRQGFLHVFHGRQRHRIPRAARLAAQLGRCRVMLVADLLSPPGLLLAPLAIFTGMRAAVFPGDSSGISLLNFPVYSHLAPPRPPGGVTYLVDSSCLAGGDFPPSLVELTERLSDHSFA